MAALEHAWAAFTGFLYDQRIPLLIMTIAGVLLLGIVAWRNGWFSAARRHPMRSASLAGIVLAVGVPVGWYLASPLVIRTELHEPLPVTASVATDTPVTPPSTPRPPAPLLPTAAVSPELISRPTSSPVATRPSRVATGRFHGSDDFHFGRGTASIIEVAPGRYHLRLEDLSVRNGPDLYVYLSPSAAGYADGAIELGRLKATDGSFGYDLPAGVEPGDFASAIIWCKQFAHLFATARFGA